MRITIKSSAKSFLVFSLVSASLVPAHEVHATAPAAPANTGTPATAPTAPAVKTPGAAPLNWFQCVELAKKNSAELIAAEASVVATQSLEGVSAAPIYPQVFGTLGYNQAAVGNDSPTSNYAAALNATENIFNGFADVSRVAQAKANTAAARAQLATAKAKLSYDLKSSFEGLVFAQQYAALTHEIVRRRQDNLRMVELRFDSGRENKGSVLLGRAYLAQANYDELQAKNARSVATRQLARNVGIDDPTELSVTDDVPINEPPMMNPDFKTIATLTPTHAQVVAQEEAGKQGIGVSKGGFYPSLGVAGSVGKQGPQFFPSANQWSVGVTLTLPFFSGGKDYYNYQSASANFTSLSNTRLSTDRQLLATLAASFVGYVEAVSKLKVDESFRDAATLRAEIARNKYNNGLLNFDDWDVIENDLINRQKAFLTSRRDRIVSEAAWEQAQGVGVVP